MIFGMADFLSKPTNDRADNRKGLHQLGAVPEILVIKDLALPIKPQPAAAQDLLARFLMPY